MTFRVLSVADLEAAQSAIWYDGQRPGLGDDFLGALRHAYQQIRAAPLSFPALESYPGPHDLRRCRLQRFPYLVIYLCRADEVLVLAVSHARRKPLYWMDRLG